MGRTSKTINGWSSTAFGLLACLIPASLSAYDGPVVHALPALGLQLGNADGLVVRSTRIEMTSSELMQTYEVENYGSQEVFSRVYAPVAPITLKMQNTAAAFSGSLTDNPLGMSVTVSENPVHFTSRVTALFMGSDIADELEAGGLGLSPFAPDVELKLEAASETFRTTARENGWVTSHGGTWQLMVLPSFRQRFAPETRALVRSRTTWVTGALIDSIIRMEDIVVGIEGDPLSRLCLLPEQEREIRELFSDFGPDEFVQPYTIHMGEFVLADMVRDTYAISDLTVRIAPDHPDDIVSVCGGDFTVQSDRSLLWEAARALPQTLTVFFISRVPAYRDR